MNTPQHVLHQFFRRFAGSPFGAYTFTVLSHKGEQVSETILISNK